MKQKTTKITLSLLSLVLLFSLISCRTPAQDLWESATYREDTSFGTGAKTVQVEVRIPEHTVTFTLHTDKDTLGDALLEHGLISGEMGPYGLYVKYVNGMLADADINGSYWSFTKEGELQMTGVDGTHIADGEKYELVYAK